MRYFFHVGLAALSMFVMGALGAQDQPSADAVVWLRDLAKAEALAAKSGKPMLLVFR